jgi:hypothetical protein
VVHTKLIPAERSRRETFANMAKEPWYKKLIHTGLLRTFLIGRRRYTTPEYEQACIAKLAGDENAAVQLPVGRRSFPVATPELPSVVLDQEDDE